MEAPGLESELFDVTVGHDTIHHDFTLSACGTRDENEPVIMRGSGNIRIAVVGISARLVVEGFRSIYRLFGFFFCFQLV